MTEIKVKRKRHFTWAPILLLLLVPLVWYLLRAREGATDVRAVVRDTGTVPADVPLPPAARAAAALPAPESPLTGRKLPAPREPAPKVSVPKVQPADPVAAARSTTTPAARP